MKFMYINLKKVTMFFSSTEHKIYVNEMKKCQAHLSTKLILQDVIELLEKRVKSRFSHRQLHMFSSLKFEEYQHLFTVMLNLPEDFPDQRVAARWNSHVKVMLYNVI